ncbi:MAG: SpoIIE family protein phosphatase [Lachnospiraceae bacterium]|nr:SpoIIE family protein phosphatase [Lachnospiraceae bacterium]
MDAEALKQVSTIREFFKIDEEKELSEGTRLLLEAMTELEIPKGRDIVTCGAGSEDGMYIILSGKADVFSSDGTRINRLGAGDFVGELGLINDDNRAATVRASSDVRCANISKRLFEDIASRNRKIYGSFMNMLYTKTTKLVTEQERIKSELSIATKIQADCLENDFTAFNRLTAVNLTAHMKPAKEVGGDFYDVFMIDQDHLCFLIADVSGKGVPAALFMTMAKTHIKNFATVGLPLAEVAARANNQLCYKNESGMFVTAFICVLDVRSGEVQFVNAGHNCPFVQKQDGAFEMFRAKANLVFGLMEDVPYREQTLTLNPGDSIYLYTDGVTEALNPAQELFGDDRLYEILNRHRAQAGEPETFVQAIYREVQAFADGEPQADDITMLYMTRKESEG